MMRKRRWVIGSTVVAFVMLTAIWLWRTLQTSEVIEVRAEVLPVGDCGWPDCFDLDGDGNDEMLVEVGTQSWLGYGPNQIFIVTMRNGQIVAYPTPFTIFATTSSTSGKRLIGIVESGKRSEVAVAELLPNGRCRIEKLGIEVLGSRTIAIGDWDGNGEDDTALVLNEKEAKVFIFQRQSNGQWRKAKEMKVSRSANSLWGKEWGARINVGISVDLPLFFWRGEWHLGQPNESISLFNADWDSNGQPDKLLVRVSPDGKVLTMHLTLETKHLNKPKQHLLHQLRFTDWEVCRYYTNSSITATNQLGDGRWHLLVLLVKSQPLTLRLMDFQLSPDRKWQEREFARWKVKGIKPPVDVLVGDGDRKAEIFVVEIGTRGPVPVTQRCFWRLVKTNSEWRPQQLHFPSQVWGFDVTKVGERLLFWQWRDEVGFLRDSIVCELGTFKVNGQWEAKWQFRSSLWPLIDDLNGDEFPEVLTFQGQVFPYPVIWWRTGSVWRKQDLVGSSPLRLINGWLHSPEGFVFPERRMVARWEGKKWFVVIWKDGVVQAVTLP